MRKSDFCRKCFHYRIILCWVRIQIKKSVLLFVYIFRENWNEITVSRESTKSPTLFDKKCLFLILVGQRFDDGRNPKISQVSCVQGVGKLLSQSPVSHDLDQRSAHLGWGWSHSHVSLKDNNSLKAWAMKTLGKSKISQRSVVLSVVPIV